MKVLRPSSSSSLPKGGPNIRLFHCIEGEPHQGRVLRRLVSIAANLELVLFFYII